MYAHLYIFGLKGWVLGLTFVRPLEWGMNLWGPDPEVLQYLYFLATSSEYQKLRTKILFGWIIQFWFKSKFILVNGGWKASFVEENGAAQNTIFDYTFNLNFLLVSNT